MPLPNSFFDPVALDITKARTHVELGQVLARYCLAQNRHPNSVIAAVDLHHAWQKWKYQQVYDAMWEEYNLLNPWLNS